MVLMIFPAEGDQSIGVQQERHIVSASSFLTRSLVMRGAPFGGRNTRNPSLDLTSFAFGRSGGVSRSSKYLPQSSRCRRKTSLLSSWSCSRSCLGRANCPFDDKVTVVSIRSKMVFLVVIGKGKSSVPQETNFPSARILPGRTDAPVRCRGGVRILPPASASILSPPHHPRARREPEAGPGRFRNLSSPCGRSAQRAG